MAGIRSNSLREICGSRLCSVLLRRAASNMASAGVGLSIAPSKPVLTYPIFGQSFPNSGILLAILRRRFKLRPARASNFGQGHGPPQIASLYFRDTERTQR